MMVKAQWHDDGLEPIGDLSLARLAVSNLAMRDAFDRRALRRRDGG